jgi:2-polyprenyl-3-methyl-5-hydroxy-6-metoxy-1,4-benzoquinol methylase
MIASPLVPNAATKLVRKIDSSKIIDGYRKELNFDVSEYFAGVHVHVRECEASGYQFYHPFSLVGKESLYRHLQQFDWNYKPYKWEYERAAEMLAVGSVLDVGCGQGAFLSIANKRGLKTHGLELNASAAQVARDRGLSVSVELIGDHAKANRETYDAVCSFQVLEHITDVHQYISDCVGALKPGGTLIFGVPNNDGFLKYADAVLNMPPHHMGLWTRKSLTALTQIFNLNLKLIETEPLSEIDWYMSVMENRYLGNKGLARSLYFRSGAASATKRMVTGLANKIPGHTIFAVYHKN